MRDLNTYLRNRFGTKVYKLALDGGMTCPNRDGTCQTRGCIFCSEGGSGDFAEQSAMTPAKYAGLTVQSAEAYGRGNNEICIGVSEQITAAKERLRTKLGNQFETTKYIAYFQSYTNTYAPVEYLRKLFTEAIEDESVVVLSVATRPDCLPDEVIALLAELNRIKPVWVELGLQTIHEKSARFIRRGYELPVFDDAVKRLEAAGIEVIVHVILGLPGETKADMLETVKYVTGKAEEAGLFENERNVGIRGIKLQFLHIMRGTDLGKMFDPDREVIRVAKATEDYPDGIVEKSGEHEELPLAIHTPDEYIDILNDALDIIGDKLVIHRLTGDAPHDKLMFPMWSANKRIVLNRLKK